VGWLGALALLAVALGAIAWLARKDRELFRVRADRGELCWEAGRLPASLRAELADVLGRARASGLVVGYRSEGRVALRVVGLDDPLLVQRLRNVVGRFPLARVAAAPRMRGHKPAHPDKAR
jgi:hypothetical protein